VLLRCVGAILILIGHGKVAGGVDLQGKMVVGENERVIGLEK
jgi:mannose/fructose-specific phosphotransferase system component IIA